METVVSVKDVNPCLPSCGVWGLFLQGGGKMGVWWVPVGRTFPTAAHVGILKVSGTGWNSSESRIKVPSA